MPPGHHAELTFHIQFIERLFKNNSIFSRMKCVIISLLYDGSHYLFCTLLFSKSSLLVFVFVACLTSVQRGCQYVWFITRNCLLVFYKVKMCGTSVRHCLLVSLLTLQEPLSISPAFCVLSVVQTLHWQLPLEFLLCIGFIQVVLKTTVSLIGTNSAVKCYSMANGHTVQRRNTIR